MKTIIFILGKTGSGKTTITNKLTEELGAKRIKLDTDRPRRDGEDNSEYRFLAKNMGCYDHEYFEKRTYNTANGEWNYATSISELYDANLFIVQGPVDMYENYKKYCLKNNIRLLPIYIKVDEYDRIKHLIDRENDKKNPDWVELFRREYDDEKQFEIINIVTNDLYTVDHKYNIDQTVDTIKCYVHMMNEYNSNNKNSIILDYDDPKPDKGIPVDYIEGIKQLVRDEIKKALEEYHKSKLNIECGDSYTVGDELLHSNLKDIYELEKNVKEIDKILDDYRKKCISKFIKQQDTELLNVPKDKNNIELIGVDDTSDDNSESVLTLQGGISVTNVQNITDSHIIATLSIDKGKVSKKDLDLLMKKYKES